MKHFFLEKRWVIKLLTVLKEVVIKRKIFFFLIWTQAVVCCLWFLLMFCEHKKTDSKTSYSLMTQLQITQFFFCWLIWSSDNQIESSNLTYLQILAAFSISAQ